ncbi:hypothetical protein BGZ93_001818 [Podila epicladia]|nr:hypothetical protein BGZ93_001818 [Podila epicladia]
MAASQNCCRLDIHHSTLAPTPAMAPLSSATSSALAPATVLNLDEDHEWGDPCLPYLAPIAASLLTCHGDALFDLAVEELALHLGVKYAFVSQLVSLEELKDLDPAEYANLIDQFGGVVPPIDGVMHNISSWPGEYATLVIPHKSHINPHAFQGYLADCTIQDKVTCIHSELAMLHHDVAECLMDSSIESYVGLRLETDQGEIVGVIGIIHDRPLTGDDASVVKMVLDRVGLRVANELDWMRVEANLIYARDVAESTAKNKTKFLADMSHEIRNPMNAVVGVTDILLDTVGLSDEQTGYIEVIRTSGQHLLTVINDILDISRIDQDVKFLLEKRPLSLRKCLKDAVSLAGLTPLHDVSRSISVIEWPPEMDDLGPFSELEETNILPLLWSIDHNVPEHLLGDITRLRQVLINLCTNSLKFTQRGRVSVHVSVHQPSQHPTIHPNASPLVTRNTPLSITSSSQAPEGVVSSPSSPMMVGCDQRPQMVFQQRYDVKADAASSNSKPTPSSRRRQGDSAFPPSSRSRASIAPTASSSSHRESSPHPPSLKVVAPTANSMQGVAKDEGSVILEFAVSDTGVGIPANKITDLFTSFSQVDISVSTRFGGTGLGLAISASLVEKMGGHIWVESTEGVGSRFTFTIPFTICQSPESDSYSSSTAPSSPVSVPESTSQELVPPPVITLPTVMEESKEEIAPSPTRLTSAPESPKTSVPTYAKIVESAPKPLNIDGSPLRILLAEDNNVNQKIAVGVLKKLGYEDVDVAENGLEVIDKLDAGRVYDVILMDVSMPVMDGIDATRTIIDRRTRGMLMSSAFAGDSEHLTVQEAEKASPELLSGSHKPELKQLFHAPHDKDVHNMYKDYQNVYVIALTASAMGSDKERCMDAGMDDFMTKPFVVLEMKRALNEYMSRLRSGALQSRNEACLAAALTARSRCRSPTCQGIVASTLSGDERPSTPTFPPALSASSSTLSLTELASMECQGCGSAGSETGSNGALPSTSSCRPSRLETPRPVRKGLDGSGPYSLGRRSNSEAILIPSTAESSLSPLSSHFGANVLENCNLSRRASESLGKREWRESPPASRSGLSNGSWTNGRHRVHPLDKTEGASGEGVLVPQMLKTKSSLYMDSSLDASPSASSGSSSGSSASSSPTPSQTNSSINGVANGVNGHHYEATEPCESTVTPPSLAISLSASLTPSPSPVVISAPLSALTSGPSIRAPAMTASTSSSALPPQGVSLPLTPPPLTPPPNVVYMKTIKRDVGIDDCMRMPSTL